MCLCLRNCRVWCGDIKAPFKTSSRTHFYRLKLKLKEPMPLKSHFSYCLLNNIGLNKFVSCGKFEIYAVCLLNAIGNERKKAEEMSRSG